MKKKPEDIQLPNEYTQLTSQTDKENKANLLFFRNLKHKNTTSQIPTKLKKVQKNIFSQNINITNSNLIKPYISTNENDFNTNSKNDNPNVYTYRRKSTMVPNISSLSINNNFLSNSLNLMPFIKKNQKNNLYILPNIKSAERNIQNETSFKTKKSKELFLNEPNKNIRNMSVHNKNKISSEYLRLSEKIEMNNSANKSGRRYLKMKTFLNINKQLNLLANEDILEKEKDKEKGEKIEIFKGLNNQNLLYSKKVNNYIFQIYKDVDPLKAKRLRNSCVIKNNGILNLRSKNIKSPKKFTVKDYINNFNPKKYIRKIKKKIKKSNIGDSSEIKNKILEKTYDTIDYSIFKNNKIMKKKIETLDKIKEKNRHFIVKSKNELIDRIINEILLNTNFKHKKAISKIFLDNLIISKSVQFFIYIKLSIIRHVVTESAKYENLYFINLIKHLLYNGDRKRTIRYTSFKSITDIISPFIKTSNYIEFNKKDIYYTYFCIKFQLLDCETLIKFKEEKKINIYNNTNKLPNVPNVYLIDDDKSDPISEKESENVSEIELRIKKMSQRSKKLKRITYINRLKFTNSSKLLNLNLTKNIIKLRTSRNLEEPVKFKSPFNMKTLKLLYNGNIKKNEFSDSSDSLEYKKYNSKKFNNNFIKSNNQLHLYNNTSIKDDNEEIHQRDKIILIWHFLYFVENSEYDKLLHWLKKSSKYMDLNYKFENGDTLLHLCVRHALPHYIYKFLISHGVNINSQNNQGDTALHLAVQNHRYKTIDFLIKMGASEYIPNKMRKFCWECL